MNILKGKTYLTKSGKLVKILWKLNKKDTENNSYFVGIYAPYTDLEEIMYYLSDGRIIYPYLLEIGADSSPLDIIEKVNEDGKPDEY